MVRIEYLLGTVCASIWGLALFAQWQLLPVEGILNLGLYGLYGIGATLGWLAGNVYVVRRRRLRGGHWRLLALYASGPLAVLVLLRALAPLDVQRAAPLVPIWGFCVYWIFFLVPVSFRGTGRQ